MVIVFKMAMFVRVASQSFLGIYLLKVWCTYCKDIEDIGGALDCFHHEKVKFVSSNHLVMFCLLYGRTQFETQVSNINFRLIMVKTRLYFN